MSIVRLSESRAYPVPVEQAFDTVLTLPLPRLFTRRWLAIPRIREVRGQGDDWGSDGASRTIVLADGGTMRETLTKVERPGLFVYTITDVTGPMRPLVARAEGRWNFTPVGTGTRVTWTWDLTPTSAGRRFMPAFGPMWRGYARRALEGLEATLLP